VGVWWRVGNTKLLKHKKHRNMLIIIYMKIIPVFFGNCLLLQVVVLVNTTNFWSYKDNSCAEFCNNGFILLSYKPTVF
jgi:hypothetical protein